MNAVRESATRPAPRELYSFGARYMIASESRNRDLRDDASCFLDSIITTVNTLAIELGDEGSNLAADPKAVGSMLWGVFHQLGMVKGIVDAMEVQV